MSHSLKSLETEDSEFLTESNMKKGQTVLLKVGEKSISLLLLSKLILKSMCIYKHVVHFVTLRVFSNKLLFEFIIMYTSIASRFAPNLCTLDPRLKPNYYTI